MKIKLDIKKLEDSQNINELILALEGGETESNKIGFECVRQFNSDKTSRHRWEQKMKAANALALQEKEPKTYPFENSSNVLFPLITIAAMQFWARAFPALVKAPDLVKYRVQGEDKDNQKANRAKRISRHMSWQMLEQDEPWEEGQSRLLMALPILGCVFKKTYYDKVDGHNRSAMVLPKNLVVNYSATSIEKCECKTEIIQMSPRIIRERVLRKIFTDVKYGNEPTPPPKEEDKRQGIEPDSDNRNRDRELLEQHKFLDLDGDGYAEPYVVTVHRATSKVVRIVARWESVTTEQSVEIEETQKRIKAFKEGIQPRDESLPPEQELRRIQESAQQLDDMEKRVEELSQQTPKVLSIKPVEYYTKYGFIPSPDGGFYDIGFGMLMGPMNDATNTLINQLIDGGHMSSGAVGFIGKHSGIKGGRVSLRPYEFQRVNSTGKAIKDSIVQLNIAAPSPVLFNLLSLLINYAERIGSVTDTMVGENPGQNTPAYNMEAMLEQGLQIFNGIFKGVYRGMRGEFRKGYALNRIFLDKETYFTYQDSEDKVLSTDYTADIKDLMPAADPNAFGGKEKAQKAQMVAERASSVPGYDMIQVEKNLHSGWELADSDTIYPTKQSVDEQGQPTGGTELVFAPQPDPKLELEKADLERQTSKDQAEIEIKAADLEIKGMLAEATVLQMVHKAENDDDKILVDKLQLQLDDMKSKRIAMTAVSVAQISAKAQKENKVDRQSTS